MILASFPADDHLLCFAGIECNTPTVCPRFDFIQVTLVFAHMILSHVFLMAIWSVESSANKWMSFSRCEAKLSINIRKDTGPRILPWWTLADIGFTDDVEPSSTTDCCLSDRKDAIQQCKSPWMPKDESYSLRPLCHTRSNAFLMSRAMTLISCWVSSALLHH